MLQWIKNRVGKDYKFFWVYETKVGEYYRTIMDWIGIKLLILARWFLKKGCKSCSHCGAKQTTATGLHMSVSRKGMRCGLSTDCDKM